MTMTIAVAVDSDTMTRPLLLAAALAAQSKARLVSVHVAVGDEGGFVSPEIGGLAARWGRTIEHVPLIQPGGLDVKRALLDAFVRLKPSLVVAGTEGRSAWRQLFSGSVAEGIARSVSAPTLILPAGGEDLVQSTGAIALSRIVIAAGDVVATRSAVHSAAWFAKLAGALDIEVVLLHVQTHPKARAPVPEVPNPPPGVRLTTKEAHGALDAEIAREAAVRSGSVVVMASRGHDSVRDATLGSHTERVVRQVRCPVLSVPIG